MGRSRELAELGSAYDSGNSLGFRNRIINGDMRIDQRNAGAAVTVTNTQVFSTDRWMNYGQAADGVFTSQQVSDAPSGFKNSLKISITTADASIGASQLYTVQHRIEGYNVADLMLGASSTQQFTLSFWVKSSVTGTFGGALGNNVDLSCPFSYTINSANTWEYKTVTFTSPASGTWNSTNGTGLAIVFSIGAGSSLKGAAGTWANYFYASTGSVDLISTLNATIQFTGVQLEAGSVATPFERRPYGTELALCQRYYEISNAAWSGQGNGSSNVVFSMPMKVTKRASPTVTLGADTGGWTTNFPSPIVTVLNQDAVLIQTNTAPANSISRYNAALAISSEL